MGKKKAAEGHLQEPEMADATEPETAVEPEEEEAEQEEPVAKVEPATSAEPRISLREFIGTYGKNTKIMARIKALKLIMGVDWLSANKTTAEWLRFCDIVGAAPVNEIKLSEWIKLVTDGGTKEQKAQYAGILKQLEV